MLYSVKNRDDLEIVNEIFSLQNQEKQLRLQDKLGKQSFHESIKRTWTSYWYN